MGILDRDWKKEISFGRGTNRGGGGLRGASRGRNQREGSDLEKDQGRIRGGELWRWHFASRHRGSLSNRPQSYKSNRHVLLSQWASASNGPKTSQSTV
jgi:hypothetical protein